jgi:hypothetical protein
MRKPADLAARPRAELDLVAGAAEEVEAQPRDRRGGGGARAGGFDERCDAFAFRIGHVPPHHRVEDDGGGVAGGLRELLLQPVGGAAALDLRRIASCRRDRGAHLRQALRLIAPDERLEPTRMIGVGDIDGGEIAAAARDHLGAAVEHDTGPCQPV